MVCFKISGKVLHEKGKLIRSDIDLDNHFLKSLRILVGTEKVPDEKGQLVRSDIDLYNHFLKSLRILVGTLPGPAVLYFFSVLKMSSASYFVVGDKKKEFSL